MRSKCRHDILNATACIQGVKYEVISLLNKGDYIHVVPALLEINFYLQKIEAAVERCMIDGNAEGLNG